MHPGVAVLGIDAAWTETEPSGVALLEGSAQVGWRCVAAAPSYDAFRRLAQGIPVDWGARHRGEPPDATTLLAAARQMTSAVISVVAVDMPLATTPIVTRRVADGAISRAFGSRHCAAHSPGVMRPGRVGRQLHAGLAAAGMVLATADTTVGTTPALLEVYPHPALLSLCDSRMRVPYKVGKTRKYWPEASADERRERVLGQLRRVADALRERGVADVILPLGGPTPATFQLLKPLEDALDAVVSAWVAVRYLERRVAAYGDKEAAIWVPT